SNEAHRPERPKGRPTIRPQVAETEQPDRDCCPRDTNHCSTPATSSHPSDQEGEHDPAPPTAAFLTLGPHAKLCHFSRTLPGDAGRKLPVLPQLSSDRWKKVAEVREGASSQQRAGGSAVRWPRSTARSGAAMARPRPSLVARA